MVPRSGTLADSNVSIPINASISYVPSAPIRVDAAGTQIVSTLAITSPDQHVDPVSDSTVLPTFFADGFEN